MPLLGDAVSTIFDLFTPLLFASNDEDVYIADASLLNHAMLFFIDSVCARESYTYLVALDAVDNTLCADNAALFSLLMPPATDFPPSLFCIIKGV